MRNKNDSIIPPMPEDSNADNVNSMSLILKIKTGWVLQCLKITHTHRNTAIGLCEQLCIWLQEHLTDLHSMI